MYRYIARRILLMIPVLVGVTLLVFTMMYFSPGDPARIILGESATEQDIATLRHEMGLDGGFFARYLRYLRGAILAGDLGTSYTTRRPVMTEILARFPTTILLAVLSVIVSTMIGIPAGIISATRQYSALDHVVTLLALVGVSMPNFWQGLVLILVFSVSLGWLPASGFYGPAYWILPSVTIGTVSAAIVTRMTRSSMLEVIRQDYIRTARAKGQSERLIIWRHALKNALIPVITVVGLQLGRGLGGAIITESIFSIPGLGKLMVDSIKARNYPVVQGSVLFVAVIFGFINLAVDIIYAFVDPRIKSQYRRRRRSRSSAALAGGAS